MFLEKVYRGPSGDMPAIIHAPMSITKIILSLMDFLVSLNLVDVLAWLDGDDDFAGLT